jgi:flagellin
MRINTNLAALTAQRNLRSTQRSVQRTVERLSSGLRVNGAKDDAAGLAMATKMRAQAQGMNRAWRNVQDGLGFLQTADGGLSTIGDIITRMRELAVQAANGTNSAQDKAQIQAEIDQGMAEIDRIGKSAEFGGRKVLSDPGDLVNATPERQVIEALRRSALPAAEQMISQYYGIRGDGVKLTVFLDATAAPGVLAFASSVGNALELHVNMSVFNSFSFPNGGYLGAPGTEFDRVIAHEMTHAIMYRTTNATTLPDWFMEGTAEFTHGAEDRLVNDLNAADGTSANGYTLADISGAVMMGNGWDAGALTTSAHYSMAFAAVSYLNDRLETAGQTMAQFFNTLQVTGNDLDDAMAATGLWADAATFVTDFKTAGNGDTYINSLDLTDANLGGIGGGTATSSVADLMRDEVNPMRFLKVVWPGGGPPEGALMIQAGANNNVNERVGLNGAIASAAILGVDAIDVVNHAGTAIDLLDVAVQRVANSRTIIGSTMNRLEYTMQFLQVAGENQTAAESRIMDADMAQETATYARQQIIQQTGLAALAQANAQPHSILSLLG